MKKITTFFLMFVLIISCSVMVSAEEITIDEKIEYLISQGIPKDFLENKEDSDINEMYNMFYGEMIEFLGTETVKMTETAYPSEISTLGTIPESDMLLKISKVQVIELDKAVNKYKVKEVVVYIDYEWLNGKPIINKEDGITVNWDSGIFTFKQDSFRSSDYKQLGSESGWVEFYSQTNPSALNQGGLGYTANLDASFMGVTTITGQKGTASFSLLPKITMYSGSGKVSSINVEYVHNTDFFCTVGFSYKGWSVSVDLSGANDSVAKALNYTYSI